MKERFCEYLYRGAVVLVLLFALYVAGYLGMVYRTESTTSIETVAEGELTSKFVGACWRGGPGGIRIANTFFRYAYWVDARYFRRHYWSSYSVIVAPGRTNFVYACDKKRKYPQSR